MNARMTMGAAVAAISVAAMALVGAPAAWAAKVTVIPGVYGPEDLEVLPDGKFVIAAQFYRNKGGLVLLDLKTDKVTPISFIAEPKPGWGEASCASAPPPTLGSHGISLSKRADGKLQLLAINHGERESVEFLEIVGSGKNMRVIWRGCVLSDQPYNDVAAMPDGGFIATPFGRRNVDAEGRALPQMQSVFGSVVMRWTPGKPLAPMLGGGSGANGIMASKDGRTAFLNVEGQVRKVDIATGKALGSVAVKGLDNSTWTADGKLIAAGGLSNERPPACVVVLNGACAPEFSADLIDPATMAITPLYTGGAGINNGTSVALQVGRTLYFGAWNGEHILKVELDK